MIKENFFAGLDASTIAIAFGKQGGDQKAETEKAAVGALRSKYPTLATAKAALDEIFNAKSKLGRYDLTSIWPDTDGKRNPNVVGVTTTAVMLGFKADVVTALELSLVGQVLKAAEARLVQLSIKFERKKLSTQEEKQFLLLEEVLEALKEMNAEVRAFQAELQSVSVFIRKGVSKAVPMTAVDSSHYSQWDKEIPLLKKLVREYEQSEAIAAAGPDATVTERLAAIAAKLKGEAPPAPPRLPIPEYTTDCGDPKVWVRKFIAKSDASKMALTIMPLCREQDPYIIIAKRISGLIVDGPDKLTVETVAALTTDLINELTLPARNEIAIPATVLSHYTSKGVSTEDLKAAVAQLDRKVDMRHTGLINGALIELFPERYQSR